MNKKFKFLITCQNCNSNNVEIYEDTDWDSMGNPYNTGYLNCKCHNCGEYQCLDFTEQLFKKEKN